MEILIVPRAFNRIANPIMKHGVRTESYYYFLLSFQLVGGKNRNRFRSDREKNPTWNWLVNQLRYINNAENIINILFYCAAPDIIAILKFSHSKCSCQWASCWSFYARLFKPGCVNNPALVLTVDYGQELCICRES